MGLEVKDKGLGTLGLGFWTCFTLTTATGLGNEEKRTAMKELSRHDRYYWIWREIT